MKIVVELLLDEAQWVKGDRPNRLSALQSYLHQAVSGAVEQVVWYRNDGDHPDSETTVRLEVKEPPAITVELGEMTERGGHKTYMAIIRKGDRYMEDGHNEIKGRAEYAVAEWRHVLLGAEEPDILAFDTDPTRPCHDCGEPYSIYTDTKKCACIPY